MPIAAKSVQSGDFGSIFGAVSAVPQRTVQGKNGGTLHPFMPGDAWKGNPGGRPKLKRAPVEALADLNDTTGATVAEAVENYKTAREAAGGITMADHKAIALTRAAADVEHRAQVAAFEASTDRLEGKVPQSIAMKSEATLTIQIVPLYAMIDGKRPPELLEAEVVEEGEK